jgi:hypothetical protein
MVYIFVLECSNDNYFVGATEDGEYSLDKYLSGPMHIFTKKYKPLKMVDFIPNCDMFDVDKYTKKCMVKYGIKKVQGGSYTDENCNFDEAVFVALNKEFQFVVPPKCKICGEDHSDNKGSCIESEMANVQLSAHELRCIHGILVTIQNSMKDAVLKVSHIRILKQSILEFYNNTIKQQQNQAETMKAQINKGHYKNDKSYIDSYNSYPKSIKALQKAESLLNEIIKCEDETDVDIVRIDGALLAIAKYLKLTNGGWNISHISSYFV